MNITLGQYMEQCGCDETNALFMFFEYYLSNQAHLFMLIHDKDGNLLERRNINDGSGKYKDMDGVYFYMELEFDDCADKSVVESMMNLERFVHRRD